MEQNAVPKLNLHCFKYSYMQLNFTKSFPHPHMHGETYHFIFVTHVQKESCYQIQRNFLHVQIVYFAIFYVLAIDSALFCGCATNLLLGSQFSYP